MFWKIKVMEEDYLNFDLRYLITEALSFSFLKPAKAILVPLIHLAGLIK